MCLPLWSASREERRAWGKGEGVLAVPVSALQKWGGWASPHFLAWAAGRLWEPVSSSVSLWLWYFPRHIYLEKNNKLLETENRLVVASGGGWGGGVKWVRVVKIK